ncbi:MULTISPECIES: S24 family peptidase [Campylobacter]|uniref:S24 family peptidase n=1 Tax=Campylobacter TaxID=194 RepID=UPI0008759E24|nr:MULTISPECIES: S24 family peptidase [Campylobacter]OEW20819.1 hypothetical protein AJ939_06120 [Campylobacter sp. BCW_6889]OEW27082.1 hypothetical protein AJ874_02710 [Campylobacter jejuni]
MDVKEILDQWKSEQKLKTYKDLAIFLGVAPNTLDVWKQRGSIPPKNILKYIQMHSSIKSTNTISIRYFPDIYASAGFGNTNENENFQIINVDKTFLTEVLGVPYKTQYDMIKINGDSMEPILSNGDFIIVDRSKNSLGAISNADIVIFRKNDDLFCKKIKKEPFEDYIFLVSENKKYEDKKVDNSEFEQCEILGAVVSKMAIETFKNFIEVVG